MTIVSNASLYITKDRLIPIAGGAFAVRYGPADSQLVLSVQADGSVQSRVQSAIGPWETFRLSGNKAIVSDSGYPTGSYALLLED